MSNAYSGSCLCGATRFEIDGPLTGPDACHCLQCRKWSGHFFVSSDVPRQQFRLTADERLRWYQESGSVRRGFCSQCGSSLFWENPEYPFVGVALGALDQPTNTKVRVHIFCSEKADYYEIEAGTPQYSTVPPSPPQQPHS